MSNEEIIKRINQILNDDSLSADAMVAEIGELISTECDWLEAEGE